MPLYDRMFWLARAYLEASMVLCEAMINDDFTRQYSSSRVVLHLARHAIELFLKGGICASTKGRPPKTHHLENLHAEYARHFPDPSFHFDIPFKLEVLPNLEMFPELTEDYHKDLDQRFRYPSDSKGRMFSDLDAFVPTAFLAELKVLWPQFLTIPYRIDSLKNK